MGLISELLGRITGNGKAETRTIADVEAALARLAAERRAASDALVAATTRRRELLLSDADDAAIAAHDADMDKTRLVLERCEAAEPTLLSELEGLRSAARQIRWKKLRERFDEAAFGYSAAFRNALEALEYVQAIRAEAQNTGFASEAAHRFAHEPNVLTREILNGYEVEIERLRESDVPRPKPAPGPSKAAQRPIIGTASYSATAKAKPAAPPPKKVARSPIIEDERQGFTRVTVLRQGFEHEGRSLAVGDVVNMSEQGAQHALRAGAVDVVHGQGG